MPKNNKPVKQGESKIMKPEEVNEMFPPEENMEGTKPLLPQIGIIHPGLKFVMPDEDETQVSKFTGVIIDTNLANAWWEKNFDDIGGGELPDCFSFDGDFPSPGLELQQAEACNKCSKNQWKSDGGRGKACKNMRRIHVLLPGKIVPYRLSIPPTSLRSFDEFALKMREKPRNFKTVVMEFTLEKTQSKGGQFTYAVVRYKSKDEINDFAELTELKKMGEAFRERMRTEQITSDQYAEDDAAKPAAEKDPF